MKDKDQPELSIILPCLNEEDSIEKCIDDIQSIVQKEEINSEIIIINNASTDNTSIILEKLKLKYSNLRVIFENHHGYGNACGKGLKESFGQYLLIIDSDQTYPSEKIPEFLSNLKEGNDLVIGNRFRGEIKEGAMPKLHKLIGNPFLSLLVRLFFNTKVGDVHCGMRAISKKAYEKIILYTSGMEFASEMIIKAVKANLKIKEIPINYYPRIGESKLKSFQDGWRHLRFILLYSPLATFLIPGLVMFIFGIISMFLLFYKNISFLGINFFVHPMFISSLMIILGYQLIIFSGFAKAYALNHLNEENKTLNFILRFLSIEKASILGFITVLIGSIIFIKILIFWITNNMPEINEIKTSILALTLIVLGIQTISSSFMLSIVSIKERSYE